MATAAKFAGVEREKLFAQLEAMTTYGDCEGMGRCSAIKVERHP